MAQKLNNLYESISEADDKAVRSGLSEKVKALQLQLEQCEVALSDLKTDFERSKNTIDATAAFQYFKVFRQEFDKQPIAVQAAILGDYVRRIIVQADGVAIVEVYGCKPRLINLGGQAKSLETKMPTELLLRRSAVRTDSKLVAGA